MLVVVGLSGVLGWLGALVVCRNARRLGLIKSANHRSSHVVDTPSGGGVGIALAAALSGVWLGWDDGARWWPALGAGLVLAGIGLRDDLQPVSARVRFVAQIVGCTVLVAVTYPQLLAPQSGAPYTGLAWALLIVLAGGWWMNLFNFMDGTDGLAGAQALFMLLAGAALAAWAHPGAMASPFLLWVLCVAAASSGYLVQNWPPARVFMGDVGSTSLAFAILGIGLFTTRAEWLGVEVWLVLGAVFVTDATVTLIARMARGDRWCEAHRSHAYQRLSRRLTGGRDGAHRTIALATVAINLMWIAPIAWACVRWPQWASAWVLVAYAPLVAAAVRAGAGSSDEG